MKGNLRKSFFLMVIFSMVIFNFEALNADWFEFQGLTTGNLAYSDSGTLGNFLLIPDSPYIIFYDNDSLVAAEIQSLKIKGSFILNRAQINTPVIVPDNDSGWKLLYTNNCKFGQVKINNDGGVVGNSWMDMEYTQGSIGSVGVYKRSEAWFVSNNIFRYSAITDKWSEYHFPIGWDNSYSTLNIYLSKDQNGLFISSKGKTIGNYQMVYIDLETGKFKLILIPEDDFPQNLRAIQEWNGHLGKYLILKRDSLWVYDFTTGSIELHINGFTTGSYNIMQDDSGKLLYLFGSSSEMTLGTTFYTLDLENKTYKESIIALEEGWGLTNFSTTFDRNKNRIIAVIENENTWEYKPIILDLNDMSVQYIPGLKSRNLNKLLYIEHFDKLIATGKNPYITMMDLATGANEYSIPLGYNASTWSIMEDQSNSIVINNSRGSEFSRLLPSARRELLDAGIIVNNIAQYSDGEKAIIKNVDNSTTLKNYIEYSFADGTSEVLSLPYNASPFFSDPYKDLIIAPDQGYKSSPAVQFIRPQGKVRLFTQGGRWN